jgi:methyl-accepting chemotaxis protein-2 (aspartate sensor receptor)
MMHPKIIAEIRDVREQYVASRFRIPQALQNHDRSGAMHEMMTRTVNVQQAYKAKVQELIAIEMPRCRRRALRWNTISTPIAHC